MIKQKKAIWLTGSSGFIGKHLNRKLISSDYNLSCISNNQNLKDECQNSDTYFLNFSSEKDIKDLIGQIGLPDVFIHLGWGGMKDSTSSVHLTNNLHDAKILIETLYLSGLEKFIFHGSVNEYGSRTGILSEDMMPLGRLTNYAKAKIKVSNYGFERSRFYKKIFIHIRLFYVFGSGQSEDSLINELFTAFSQNRDTRLSSCLHFRDFIHVSDVVEGIMRLISVNESHTVNLGSGSFISVREYVNIFWNEIGGDSDRLKFGSHNISKSEPDQYKSYADLTTIKKLTGWSPTCQLEKCIRNTVAEINDSDKKTLCLKI